MTTQSEAVSSMVAMLRVSDPELDTSIGSTTRKILDAVGEMIAEGSIDNHLGTYQYDIDSKIGADLDDFVQMFGMARIAPRRASGVVSFTRGSDSDTTSVVFLPVNTQIASITSPSVLFSTVSGAYMEPGVTSVDVAVQAVDAGSQGNVPASTVVTQASPLTGVGSSTNMRPMTGGTDQEADSALRKRWKDEVFRNLAGTEQMYLGIALADASAYVANIVTAAKRRREQVQIVSGVGQCTVDDAAFIYAEPVFVGANIDGGAINVRGSDYTWDTTVNPPRFQVLNAPALPDGAFVEVDFQYMPQASRNDPANGITNRVDIWVAGSRAFSVTQATIFRSDLVFTNTALGPDSTDPMSRHLFRRLDTAEAPDTGNVFLPLAWGPIITVPPTINVGAVTYGLASDVHPMGTSQVVGDATIYYTYRIVHRDDAFGYGVVSDYGLEWYGNPSHDAPFTLPPDNTVFTVGNIDRSPYLFNQVVSAIQTEVDRWRLAGIDAKVHQAKERAFRVGLAIMYSPKANVPTVNTAIDTALATLMQGTGFQGRLQASDILQTAHNVPGVDNVRFLRGTDYPGYDSAHPEAHPVGVQQIVGNNVVAKSWVDSTGRATDVALGDDEVPVYYGSVIVQKAENTFGVM